jgi:hypothetical protein
MRLDLTPADQKFNILYSFFERNKTLFALIAVFGALAGFLYGFNKLNLDDNIIYGILFLVLLIGLMMILIVYDAFMAMVSLFKIKYNSFNYTFQSIFLGIFIILLLMFYQSLMEYLFSNFLDPLIWLELALLLILVKELKNGFIEYIQGINDLSKWILGSIIVIYTLFSIWVLKMIFSIGLLLGSYTYSLEGKNQIGQICFFLLILLYYFGFGMLSIGGILIKKLCPSKSF